jgi:cobalt-precorrin-5B (C1)-methyltransferase
MTSTTDIASAPEDPSRDHKPEGELRRGWTTGACATAASKAALVALITGKFDDPVTIRLPKGEEPAFPLAFESLGDGYAVAGIVKDAGDDPDVTHGATIIAMVRPLPPGSGIRFAAGDGVGTVTKPGLPIGVGEPAINPVPRKMMTEMAEEICAEFGLPADLLITISIPGGEEIAEKTWNPRLGVLGGLSILGTTGIVHPFSCSAWIHSIHRGIDVARAEGLTHVLGATGSTSEKAAQDLYGLPDGALLDMGDFAGGLLKYLRQHPVARLTIAGGFAKMTKLAQGALDLHSGRSQVDMGFFEKLMEGDNLNQSLKDRIQSANTALEVLEAIQGTGIDLPARIAEKALQTARETLRDAPVSVDIVITDRQGKIIARAG